jgi:rhodanese-related sulfurtransferase
MLDWLLGKRGGDGLHAATLAARLNGPEALTLLDVREPQEWAEGRIAGAVHIPLGELPTRWQELPASKPVAVICRSGARSARATAFLHGQGVDAQNVEGGMLAWNGPITRG